ncbi:putative GMC oxidoreductase [Annulohypoxylon truncatum]|uniref:putative GMC oxidoreductase n=1 Tax=Annulohypoxylon truncatum TaxID=327061 RepID=UPI0020081228|nr:putative GMC oxidoreductase [Annulohypoxylon truncatum]KAI1208533.1 putative GMC oxidoreductase [Annulohypoxylon truncatum]
MAAESYDFVIIGGGTAGLTVATRLSEDPNKSILVIEAGSNHSKDPRVKTPALFGTMMNTDLHWGFQTKAQANMNLRRMNMSQGRILGGSSAVNAEIFLPPTKKLIDSWASLGNDGWDWDGLGQYYAKTFTSPQIPETLERSLGIDRWAIKNDISKGPLELSFPGNPSHPIRKAWAETFRNMGYLMANNPFVDPSIGVGAFSNLANIDPVKKERSHAANAYYDPIKSRKNLHVVTGALAERVLFRERSTTAIGVQYRHGTEAKIAKARKEVILAAGALQTPKILELSGVGNADVLNRHGIEVVKNIESVGENFQDHLLCGMVFEANDDIETLDVLFEPKDLEQAMNEYARSRTGPLSTCGIHTCAYMPVTKHQSEAGQKSLKELLQKNRPPVETPSDHSQARAAAYYEIAEKTLLDPKAPSAAYITSLVQGGFAPDPLTGKPPPPVSGRYIEFITILAQPLSRGSVHIASQDISEDPVIDPKYLTNPVDLDIFAEHVLSLPALAASQPLTNLLKQPLRISPSSATFADLDAAKEYIRGRSISMWHPAGTCAMLPESKGGVVDTRLKVYGIENLRVVDASIVPLLPPGNLQSTVYAVAEKAADLIKSEHGMNQVN